MGFQQPTTVHPSTNSSTPFSDYLSSRSCGSVFLGACPCKEFHRVLLNLFITKGEAEGELEQRLESEALRERIVGIETVDKMTDRQIAARVQRHFPKRNHKGS